MHLFVVLNLVPLLIRVDLLHFHDWIWYVFLNPCGIKSSCTILLFIPFPCIFSDLFWFVLLFEVVTFLKVKGHLYFRLPHTGTTGYLVLNNIKGSEKRLTDTL